MFSDRSLRLVIVEEINMEVLLSVPSGYKSRVDPMATAKEGSAHDFEANISSSC